uniref:Prolyl endopeptidase n=2 Tax=Physcomitrium patens TaxID=3218 RepID=A0A2K1JU65_PHYPA|nr:hypothetical protein PHYPA_014843 [Physcomitrium patens]
MHKQNRQKTVKFSSLAWTHHNKDFVYNRYPKPTMNEIEDEGTETDSNLFQELHYHFLGTDQSQDILCWRDSEHAEWTGRAETKLIDKFDAQYGLVANEGSLFTFLTNKDAPKNKLTRVSLDDPSSWKDVVPESESDVLTSADLVNRQQLVLCYMNDVKHQLQMHDLQSGHLLQKLPLEIGSISEISSRPEDADFFYSFTSFLTPGIIYRCDFTSGTPDLSVLKETKIANWDRSLFEIRQEFATSKDETRVPMFVVAKKGLVRNGDHPAVLYGYGGFNVSLMPFFSVSRLVLVQHYGAVVATANTRGGGEYGEKWHKAGALANKQNCFDDFIACDEHLIKEGYKQNKKLCIEGKSNGGLLVAVCINQLLIHSISRTLLMIFSLICSPPSSLPRPDLFGCALAHVGVMDMLRFQKFTIGHAWISDYGCADIAEEFDWLINYSPLHNVKRPWENGTKSIQYPATTLFTADHDDRVVPSHSLKLLATLQYELCTSLDNSQRTNPIIRRIETGAGHGSGRPTMKIIDEMVDAYSFFAKMTDSAWIE